MLAGDRLLVGGWVMDAGKQFVVVTAVGGRTAPDRGDYIIAYALPEQTK